MELCMRIKRTVLFTILSFFLSLEKAIAQGGSNYSGWCFGPGMMGGWGMGVFGMIFMAVFCFLVIMGLVFLIKGLVQSTKGERDVSRGSSRALDIIKERYARGEITKEEFEQMKQTLQVKEV